MNAARILLAGTISLGLAGTAHAAGNEPGRAPSAFPVYDPTVSCKGHDQADQINCMGQVQEDYDSSKLAWETAGQADRDVCLDKANSMVPMKNMDAPMAVFNFYRAMAACFRLRAEWHYYHDPHQFRP